MGGGSGKGESGDSCPIGSKTALLDAGLLFRQDLVADFMNL